MSLQGVYPTKLRPKELDTIFLTDGIRQGGRSANESVRDKKDMLYWQQFMTDARKDTRTIEQGNNKSKTDLSLARAHDRGRNF